MDAPTDHETAPTVEDIGRWRESALRELTSADDLDTLDEIRVRYTGRRSQLAAAQKQLGNLDADQRREVGAAVNEFHRRFASALATRHDALASSALASRLAAEAIDVTATPRRIRPGRPHLLTQVEDEIVDAMIGLGYRVAEGPEVESAAYSFDLLNIPIEHPARQEMDTVYVDDDVVMRPHTSPVQARVMLSQPPPIAVVCPGRVFRNDAPDATHSPVFRQVEGLAVAPGLTMADLRGTLLALSRALFGPSVDIRLRPGHFPFTEPSAEIDVTCPFCAGSDGDRDLTCRVCSGTGWIEILGAGMVDPNVLTACGLDPDEVSGFAFGIGVERVAMLRHGVPDVREFYENDARFLERF